MTTFQFLPNPSSDNFAIRRFNLESDVMPPRADGGNGGRTRTDAVVQHHIALVGIGTYQVLYQGYRLLCSLGMEMTEVGYLSSATRTGASFISP